MHFSTWTESWCKILWLIFLNKHYNFYFHFFWDGSLTLVTQAGVQWQDLSSLQPPPLRFDSSASASWVAGTTGARHHTQLIFVFLVEMGFHHVGQDGLDLLTSWSACLGLPKCWDYRLEPPHPANFCIFSRGFTMFARLVLTPDLVICLPPPPKVLGLQEWAATSGWE